MNRLIRSVAVGGGAALAVGGAAYIFEQQQLAQKEQPVHIPAEWGFDVRNNVLRAGTLGHRPLQQAEYYEKALDSLLGSRTNLRDKSQAWLEGYGDLLRALAVSRAEAGEFADDAIVEPLLAAQTVPFGSPQLRAVSAALGYQITADPAFLAMPDLQPPATLDTERQVRAWAPLSVELAKRDIAEGRLREAMARLLTLHRSITAATDPLCLKAATGGYVAQVLWRLGRKDECRRWLELSQSEADACHTPACRETRDMLSSLLAKAA